MDTATPSPPRRIGGRIAYATGPLAVLAIPTGVVLDDRYYTEPVVGLTAWAAGLILMQATGFLARQAWIRWTAWLLVPACWLGTASAAIGYMWAGTWWPRAEPVGEAAPWLLLVAAMTWFAWSVALLKPAVLRIYSSRKE
jgi:hypothetical protein